MGCIELLPSTSAVEVIESEPSFCVCVFIQHSHGRTVLPMTLIFGMRVDIYLSWAGNVGQGRRSKVKVTRLENVIFRLLLKGIRPRHIMNLCASLNP